MRVVADYLVGGRSKSDLSSGQQLQSFVRSSVAVAVQELNPARVTA